MKTCNELTLPREIAVREALQKVIDPEIGESIVDVGLIYGIELQDDAISIRMTMTSPACPMGEMILDEVHAELVHAFPEAEIDIEMVWEPVWNPDMISPEAKARLGWK
ncbi:MAG: metal-sulfur cluster assembly factor [Methylophilaceae bacterium]